MSGAGILADEELDWGAKMRLVADAARRLSDVEEAEWIGGCSLEVILADDAFLIFGDGHDLWGCDIYFRDEPVATRNIALQIEYDERWEVISAALCFLVAEATAIVAAKRAELHAKWLDRWVSAGFQLLEYWDEDSVTRYPEWAPSFDELLHEMGGMLDV